MTSDHSVWLRRLLEQVFADTADEDGGWVSVVTRLMQAARVCPETQQHRLRDLIRQSRDNEVDRLRFLEVEVDAMSMELKTPKVH